MEVHFQNLVSDLRTNFYKPAQARAYRKVVFHFAMELATVATNASLAVLIKIIAVQLTSGIPFRFRLRCLWHSILQYI
jgi:hypothetical protein